MALNINNLSDDTLAFLVERHLATLTTQRADGSPHVVPVGFSYDPADRIIRIISFEPSQKAANAERGGRAAVSQVDGGRWLTLEGTIRLTRDPAAIERAVVGYAARYSQPGDRPNRIAIEIHVDRILGRA